ncbi:MAG: nucleoside hydrolase [Alphaproteobacteria bacterium]|nr:nucleoside hydrolase [Alphaproteobacteria bacterium]
MTRESIILDCDTGRDDAVAIALALASPEIDVLGVTAVAGNAPLAMTERNCRFVCELCGRADLPVHAGADRPLLRDLVVAAAVHGTSGIEGIDDVQPTMPLRAGHAVAFILETLEAAPGPTVTLVPTGPLTNLALAYAQAPALFANVKQIVLMGGARREGGNVTPTAEFNIYVDPHAAKIVFGCGRPIVAISLDITHRVLAEPRHAARLRERGGVVAATLAPLLAPTRGVNRTRHGIDRSPLHDPCTIAWLLRPDLFKTKHVNVEVETEGSLTLGETVVDFWARTERAPNVHWAHDVDVEGVFDLLIERIARL